MDVGQSIRIARKQRGMTQAYLAKQLNVEPTTVDRWEGAICTPAPQQLRQLCAALNLNLDTVTATAEPLHPQSIDWRRH